MRYERYGRWRRYVPLGSRRANAGRRAKELAKDGVALQPVLIAGLKIATSFWGKAWCDNLERYSDSSNRLPRGRTYARNGSVIDLRIGPGKVDALVSGSDIYTVAVTIKSLPTARWRTLVAECSGRIGSLLDLLQGRFSTAVMQVLARAEAGLFPVPKEIAFTCSCPDYASMCKHVAAVLYGVGARFDAEPELFFALRQVDSKDLIAAAAGAEGFAGAAPSRVGNALEDADLGGIFGIDLDVEDAAPGRAKPTVGRRAVSERASRKGPAGKVPTKRRPDKAASPRKPRRAPAVDDDGFGEVFGPDLEVTPALLLGFGVPRTTFTNWIQAGVLVRTTTRGVYRTTAATLDRVRIAYARTVRKD